MTGKEALSKLDRNIHFALGERKDLLEYIHIIEKDLEVLEIIKECMTSRQGPENYFGIRIYWVIALSLNIDEYNKIQEWLKNERQIKY